MAEINLSKYGITGTTEIVYNPSYEVLYEEETKPELEGFEMLSIKDRIKIHIKLLRLLKQGLDVKEAVEIVKGEC